MVDATVNDQRSLLDPLSFHHLSFPDADDQDVCLSHLDKPQCKQLKKFILEKISCLYKILIYIDIDD